HNRIVAQLFLRAAEYEWKQQRPGKKSYEQNDDKVIPGSPPVEVRSEIPHEIFFPEKIAKVSWIPYLAPYIPRGRDAEHKESSGDQMHLPQQRPFSRRNDVSDDDHPRQNQAYRPLNEHAGCGSDIHQGVKNPFCRRAVGSLRRIKGAE